MSNSAILPSVADISYRPAINHDRLDLTIYDEYPIIVCYTPRINYREGGTLVAYLPTVLSLCAIQSSVEEANSVWIVFWSLASVSTSTLLVASS